MQYVILGSIIVLLFLMGRSIWKNKHHSGPNLTNEEHPSTFKKPGIEMIDDKESRNLNT